MPYNDPTSFPESETTSVWDVKAQIFFYLLYQTNQSILSAVNKYLMWRKWSYMIELKLC